jgi:hypothetical protein
VADNGCGIVGWDDTDTIGATVIAQNTVDCSFLNALVTDEGYNLTDDSSCQGVGRLHQSTDKTVAAGAVDLGLLRNNGGPTETMLPALGSPAFGAVPPGTTLGPVQVCPRVDQRGVPSAGNCSTGAVEPFGISTTSLPNATPGTAYGPVTLTTQEAGVSTSPNVTTLKWKKVALPKGLKLSSTGVLSGTPSSKLLADPNSATVQVTETVITLNGKMKVKTPTTVEATIPLAIT